MSEPKHYEHREHLRRMREGAVLWRELAATTVIVDELETIPAESRANVLAEVRRRFETKEQQSNKQEHAK